MMAWFRQLARKPPPAQSEDALSSEGQAYRDDTPYLLPSALAEVRRQDFQHHLLRHVLRSNYLAPIRAPTSILDVGSGSGQWCIEMALQFPQANVVGLDKVFPPPLQPGMRLPDNYLFLQGDMFAGLPFAGGTFDLAHQRCMVTAIPVAQWQASIRELVRIITPAGWVELVEISFAQNGGRAMTMLNTWLQQACRMRGLDFSIGNQLGPLLREAGLININFRRFDIPLGEYGGRDGTMMAADYFAGLHAVGDVIIGLRLTSLAAYERAIEEAKQEIATNQCTVAFYFAYGQCPSF